MLLTFSACSTLVGSVKPVDEKSTAYGVANLAKDNPDVWVRLGDAELRPKDAQIGSDKAFSSEITDVAYQSKRTSAIISLNSSCRDGRETIPDVAPYLRELLLGMTDVSERTENSREIAGADARESTVAGNMAGQATKIRALVLAKSGCIYDLMYISRPGLFPVHENDFNRFVSSLRLR
jgi:hypothetical protein